MKKYLLRYLPLLILVALFVVLKLHAASQPLILSNSPAPATSHQEPEKALYALAFPDAQEGWAVGGAFLNNYDGNGHLLASTTTGGLIWHYTNGNWSISATVAQPLRSVSMDTANDGWAVGDSGELLHYVGQTWKNASDPTQSSLSAVTALSANNAWAVGLGGAILHYDGTSWNDVHSPTSANLRSIAFSSPDDGWIVGDQGTLLHYQQQGWQKVASPTNEALYSVTMLSSEEGWAVGANETILHDREGNWYTVGKPGTFNLANPYNADGSSSNALHTFYTISMTSVLSGWIASTNGLLSYTHEVWSANQNGVLDPTSSYIQGNMVLYGVQMFSAQEGWAVGEYNQDVLFFHYQNGTWQDYS